MMSAVDRSFTDQSTLQEDERLGLSFMDAHGYSPRGECWGPGASSSWLWAPLPLPPALDEFWNTLNQD